MTANKLGGRMYNDVRAMLQRLHQVGSGQGIIDNEWHSMLVGNIGHSADIDRIQARIAHRLRIDRLGALVNGRAEAFRVAAIHKAHSDAEFGQRIMEKIVGTPIKASRRDNFIASASYI